MTVTRPRPFSERGIPALPSSSPALHATSADQCLSVLHAIAGLAPMNHRLGDFGCRLDLSA